MKNTNPIFSLKNFRSFGEEGADFELAPITVLTGCNSAGKSSLVKALLLLSKEKKGVLPVSTQEYALGRFDKILNNKSKNGIVELSYLIWSTYFQEIVKVIRVYKAHNNDPLNNGELIELSVKKMDGTTIYEEFGPHVVSHFDGEQQILCEIMRPSFLKDVMYCDSSSANVKRLYNIEDGSKMCNALRGMHSRYLSDNAEEIKHYNFTNPITPAYSFINHWIKQFGIGDEIVVESAEQGLGIMVFLKRDGEKRLLADEGYGITQLVSLLINIENNIPFQPDDYDDEYVYNPRYICVEEPEIHLHPKYQSLLADMFVEAYQKYNIHFIIETHSEYLIRKLQVMVADKGNALTPNDVSLNYVEKDEHGISTNRKIDILEDGRLSEPFGPGFCDEATGLSMELLRMKIEAK